MGGSICNSLCSQSNLCLSHTGCFYLFLDALSLCLAPEQTALTPCFVQQIQNFKPCKAASAIGSERTSSTPRYQPAALCCALQLHSDQIDPIKKKTNKNLPVKRGNWMSSQSKCLRISQVFVFGFRRNCLYVRHIRPSRSVSC